MGGLFPLPQIHSATHRENACLAHWVTGWEAVEGKNLAEGLRKAGDVKLRMLKPGRIHAVTGISTCRFCLDLNTVCRPR